MHFLSLLLKRKRLVILGSVIPAIIIGVIVFLWPTYYTLTLAYERSITEKDYRMLLERFYSEENINKITTELRKNQLNQFADKIEDARSRHTLNKLINVQVAPAFPIRLKTTDPATSEEISKMETELLLFTIKAQPREDVHKIAQIVTDNFKKVIPLYALKDDLNAVIRENKRKLADIQQNRFDLEVKLARQRQTLDKQKALTTEQPTKSEGNIILQVGNIADNLQYLPLDYQIQAVASQVINLEETMRELQKRFEYAEKLLRLDERIFEQAETKFASDYNIEQFHSFLNGILPDYKDKAEVFDYLSSYIFRVENVIASNVLVTEKPQITPVKKYILAKASFTFLILLLTTTFISVSLEYNGENLKR